jgi:hypothetical protein
VPKDFLARHREAVAIGAVLALIAAILVGMIIRRPPPPSFVPSPIQANPAGEALIGPEIRTVEATDGARWIYFSFQMGSVVETYGPLDWDLAFRRFQVIANGGERFAGRGGILDLGPVDFDSVRAVPGEGYEPTVARTDSVNAAIADWYDYSFFSHLLTPRPHVYAVRTADGRYAKMELLGYYCPGATPGCMTFRYVYQGDGSTNVDAAIR